MRIIKRIVGYITVVCIGIGCIGFVKGLERQLSADKPEQAPPSVTHVDKVNTYRRNIAFETLR